VPAYNSGAGVRVNVMTDNIIVEILKYGRIKKPGKEMGFTRDDLKLHLKNLGFKMDYEDDQTTNIIFDNCFTLNVPQKGQYVMRADAYFTLLEYEELEEARASSKQANIWAIVALGASILGTIFAIGFSLKQINTPTEIKQTQIDQIVSVLTAQKKQIDSLIKLQQTEKVKANQHDTLCKKNKHYP
jgi:hypothetical protein